MRKKEGWEEETLAKVYEYCQEHTEHNVIYKDHFIRVHKIIAYVN